MWTDALLLYFFFPPRSPDFPLSQRLPSRRRATTAPSSRSSSTRPTWTRRLAPCEERGAACWTGARGGGRAAKTDLILNRRASRFLHCVFFSLEYGQKGCCHFIFLSYFLRRFFWLFFFLFLYYYFFFSSIFYSFILSLLFLIITMLIYYILLSLLILLFFTHYYYPRCYFYSYLLLPPFKKANPNSLWDAGLLCLPGRHVASVEPAVHVGWHWGASCVSDPLYRFYLFIYNKKKVFYLAHFPLPRTLPCAVRSLLRIPTPPSSRVYKEGSTRLLVQLSFFSFFLSLFPFFSILTLSFTLNTQFPRQARRPAHHCADVCQYVDLRCVVICFAFWYYILFFSLIYYRLFYI